MKRILATLCILVSSAFAKGDSDIIVTLDQVEALNGYRFFVSPRADDRVLLCMRSSVATRTAPMQSSDTYYSNQVPTGPTMLRPLCAIKQYDENGTVIGSSAFQDRSLLDTRMTSPPPALVLQGGDRLALHDGVYKEKPKRAEIRIVIFEGNTWVEKTLHWKNENG